MELFSDGHGITGVRIQRGRQGCTRACPPWCRAGDRWVRVGRQAGRGVPARPDARCGVTAEQHRRRAAYGDGARRGPGEHGRSLVGADRAAAGRHLRGTPAQPQCATRKDPSAKHHRQPSRQEVPQRGGRVQLDGWPVPVPRPARRLCQRPRVDRLRLTASQALRLPWRRPR